MDGLVIAGRVWLSEISGVERNGLIPLSKYIDSILLTMVVLFCSRLYFCPRVYIEWHIVGWVWYSVVGWSECDEWSRVEWVRYNGVIEVKLD